MNDLARTIDRPNNVDIHEVRTFREVAKCENMGCDGNLVYTGTSNPMSPPIYHHRCDLCGLVIGIRGVSYPRTVYR